MDKCWIEFSFPVPAGEIDLISDALYAIDCVGVNVEERTLDTFTVPDPEEDIPASYDIKAYFLEPDDSAALAHEIFLHLRPSLPDLLPAQIQLKPVRQEDWAEGWKQHFSAIRFGPRLVIKPTWESWQQKGYEAIVSLDPGMAFGTGSHETTRLCLQALADQFEEEPGPASVLDVGTGSGILAISAALLGASQVIGCEIDTEACRVATENVLMNNVADTVKITDQLLDDIEGRYDLVIANIMAEENVRLAAQLVSRLADHSTLILSGILKEKDAFVCDGFSAYNLPEPVIHYDGDWCCICYSRRVAE